MNQSLMSLNVAAPRTSFLPALSSTTGRHAHSARLARHGRRVPGVAVAAAVPLTPEFGYVVLTASASAILTQWQMFKMYEDAEDSVFNCYQRAHQNTLENYPAFLALLLISGFEYPITASVFGMVWVLGRVLYSLGYYTGNPQNRFRGIFNSLGLFGLLITSIVYGVRQVMPLLSA